MNNFETLAIHSGYKTDATQACNAPIHRTTAYVFKNAEHASDLFALKELGNIYSRLTNPTVSSLEERINALEGGAGALAFASGTAAIFNTVINIAKMGDEIVSTNNLYGGTYTMFDAILPQYGINTRLVNVNDMAACEAAINAKTRLIYIETIGNPGLDVADIEKYAALAQKYHLPLVVDATFATPWLMRPLEYGANVVVHSLTKWIGGHGSVLGGIAVDGNNFDWTDPKFDLYNLPDESYHGIRWGHDLPLPAFITRMRTVPLRNLGACLSADNAWQIMQGVQTLALRMERHSSNAATVATMLENHPKTDWVRYPGLKNDKSYELAQKILPKGFGGMVVFGVKGGKEAGKRFIEALQLFSHVANVGDTKSLALHPGSTSHSQLSNEQQIAAGLKPELIRLSIGIEYIDDIIEDLCQALDKA